MSDIDSLLDQNLDDLADLAGFEPFPTGVYHVGVEFAAKEINKHPSIEVKLICQSVVEIANPGDKEVKPGDSCNTLFALDVEQGQGFFKQLTEPLKKHYEVTSIRQLADAMKGGTFKAVVESKPDKNDVMRIKIKSLEVV